MLFAWQKIRISELGAFAADFRRKAGATGARVTERLHCSRAPAARKKSVHRNIGFVVRYTF
jgi:hypothetical protein